MFQDLVALRAAGFEGFVTIDDLRKTKLSQVPPGPGVYVVVLGQGQAPAFLEKSVGGHFKRKDPTVPLAMLRMNWVADTVVLYIGKADALRHRIGTYLKFGEGKAVAHKGGRLIWQLQNPEQLLVGWMETPLQDPRQLEKCLIEEFKLAYWGQRPFANLRG